MLVKPYLISQGYIRRHRFTRGLLLFLPSVASLNATLLVASDRSRRKPVSCLPTSYRREVEQHDLDLEAIQAFKLGVNSFIHLSFIEPTLANCEDVLFSDLE